MANERSPWKPMEVLQDLSKIGQMSRSLYRDFIVDMPLVKIHFILRLANGTKTWLKIGQWYKSLQGIVWRKANCITYANCKFHKKICLKNRLMVEVVTNTDLSQDKPMVKVYTKTCLNKLNVKGWLNSKIAESGPTKTRNFNF